MSAPLLVLKNNLNYRYFPLKLLVQHSVPNREQISYLIFFKKMESGQHWKIKLWKHFYYLYVHVYLGRAV